MITVTNSFNEPLRHRFISSPSEKILRKLGLYSAGDLIKRGDHNVRATESAAQGGDKHMSSKEMYRQLNHIRELVPVIGSSPNYPALDAQPPLQSEGTPHLNIETILFRASAMLQGSKCMVLKVEKGDLPTEVPYAKGSRTRKLSGIAGYNVFVVNNPEHGTSSPVPSRPPNLDPYSRQSP